MSNFFQLYHDFTKESEPPQNYQAWSAIGAISALLGKKCVIPYGTFNVYPNLYIVLVGKPGLRKSSAMNVAKRLCRSVTTVKLASDSGSREGMMDEMAVNKVVAGEATYWQSAIFVDEVGDFLGGDHLDSSMVRFLTTIWDQTIYKEATRKGGQVTIHNPYLTLLGCCPTKWIATKLQADVVTDGLSRRMIFVVETKMNCINPQPPPPDVVLRSKLELEAKRIHGLGGVFGLTQEAWDYFDDIYRRIQREVELKPESIQSYYSSKHMLMLKVAMCLSAGVSSDQKITKEMISVACSFLEQTEQNLIGIFSGIGRNELNHFAQEILGKIKAAGKSGMTKADVIKMFYNNINMGEIDEACRMLEDTKQVSLRVRAAQGAPSYLAEETAVPPPDVSLMPLARQLLPCPVEMSVVTSGSGPIRHLDPATELLLFREKQYLQQTSTGLLLKGTRAPVSGVSLSLLEKLPE